MTLTEAWLILISGVSLLSFAQATDQVQLNAKTCNKDPFTLRCYVPKECSGAVEEWMWSVDDKLNTCHAMIGIRRSMHDKYWMVVLQLRGTTVDHGEGIIFYEGDSIGPKDRFRCLQANGKTDIIDMHESNTFMFEKIRTSYISGSLTLCELRIHAFDRKISETAFKEAIGFYYTMKSTGEKVKSSWANNNWNAKTNQGVMSPEIEKCKFPLRDTTLLNKDEHFYLLPSIWEKELKCSATKDELKYKDHYKLNLYLGGEMHKIDKMECNVVKKLYEYDGKTFDANSDVKAMCIAQACSMCDTVCSDQPGTVCPKHIIDEKTGCTTLNCTSGVYKVDGGTPSRSIPTCQKTEAMKKLAKDKGIDMWNHRQDGPLSEWRFNGKIVTKVTCEKFIPCVLEEKYKDPKSKEKIHITTHIEHENQTVTCNSGQLRYDTADGTTKDLLRLECNKTTGNWMQVDKDDIASAFPNRTLQCSEDDGAAGADEKVGAAMIGGVAGGIAIVAIIVIVAICCCKRRRKKQQPDTKASMTAVSSGDKKTSDKDKSQSTEIPKTAPSAPVSLEPMKKLPVAPQPPRSDNTTEQKKEDTTKKEFLKFDDSQMSDMAQISKKPEDTERLDLLQREAEKLSMEQKRGQEDKSAKKDRDLYPRLADIDDDWKNSEEDKIGESGKKKPQAPSDKTTVMSKLNSKPLKNAPHDDGQYEALGMQTVMVEKTAIDEKTNNDDESGSSKKSTKTRTKMAIGDASAKKDTKSGAPSKLRTALDAKLADMEQAMEKTAILNDVDEGETQAGTHQTRTTMQTTVATGKTKDTTMARTQSKDRTTIGTTQGGITGTGATTQRTRTQTRTRGDPTQIPSFEGVTARDPTAYDETQAGTDGTQARTRGFTTNDPTQLTDGRTAREVTANDVTQGTDGFTAKELTPVDFTQGRTTTGRTAKELTVADFTQNRTPTSGMTAMTTTRAARTQDQTTRTADQETQDPTLINDPTQILTRTRRTSRTQGGFTRTGDTRTKQDSETAQDQTRFDPTQDPTAFDQTQAVTEGRTGVTRTRAARTQDLTRTGATRTRQDSETAQDQTRFDPTQDPTAFDQTQLTGGGRTRTSRTQDQTMMNDQTQAATEGRTGVTKTRASRTQGFTRTGNTQTRQESETAQDQTRFDPTQDPTAFEQTQLTGGGRTRTSRTQTQADTGLTQQDGETRISVGDPTQAPSTDGKTAVSRTKGRTTQEQTRDPTGTQDPTMLDGATQLTDGRTGVTKTRASRTQGTTGRTQDPTTAFDQTQLNTDGRTAVSKTKASRTQTGTRTKDPTQEPTAMADGTQAQTEGRTAVSRTKGRTTQGETAFDGTQVNTEGKTAVSRTKGRTTQGDTAFDGTQAQTDGKTAVSRTKGRTTQGETAFDGTQVPTDGKTAVSRTKGRTTQDFTTANDGTQLQTEGQTAVSKTKATRTQDPTAFDGTQVQTEGRTAVSKTKGSKTQEATTAVTRGQTTRTQEQTAVAGTTQRTRTKSQEGTRTPADTQADGQTDAKERTRSKESRTGAEPRQTQSRTGAEGPPSSAPSAPSE